MGVPIQQTAAEAALPVAATTLGSVLEHIFPASIIDAMARNDVLQVVVFAFLFGAACATIGAKAEPVVKFCGSLAEVMFRYTRYVMYLAPLGVGAAIGVTVGAKGIRRAVRPWQADRHDVPQPGGVRGGGAGDGGGAGADSAGRVLPRRARAVSDRLFHRFERSRAAAGARKHGALRRAQAHRGIRHSGGLQLQPGWHHAVSLAGFGFRGAGGRGAACRSASSYS